MKIFKIQLILSICICIATTFAGGEVHIEGPFDPFYEHLSDLNKSLVATKKNALSTDDLETLNRKLEHLEITDDPTRAWREDRKYLVELVDPLKYCWVDGVTKLKSGSKADELKSISEARNSSSSKFQIIPSEIKTDSSFSVKFTSYINNLRAVKCQSLYKPLAGVVSASLPLFEEILKGISTSNGTDDGRGNLTSRMSLRARKLQIVVGVRNVILPPNSNATYAGSSWHQEGVQRENIVASAVFYRDVRNIKDSILNLRVQLDKSHTKFKNFKPVLAKTNLLVAFPNLYEHKVESFGLLDERLEGVRKIVTVFLINPWKRIVSTSSVLPQQKEWMMGGHADLEYDLEADLSYQGGCCKMTLKQAKMYYKEAVKERTYKGKNKRGTGSATISRGSRFMKPVCQMD